MNEDPKVGEVVEWEIEWVDVPNEGEMPVAKTLAQYNYLQIAYGACLISDELKILIEKQSIGGVRNDRE